MTDVHSAAELPAAADAGHDAPRAPFGARVVIDASGAGPAAADALSGALAGLGFAPEAPYEHPGPPGAYCALLIGEEAYGADAARGLDRGRVLAAADAMAAAGRGRLVLVTDAGSGTHTGTDPERHARLAADLAWWQHLATGMAGYGVAANTVRTGYAPALGHALPATAEAGLLRYLVQRRATTAADVAGTVGFLLSAGCSYLIGETVPVDGGAGLGQIPALADAAAAPAPARPSREPSQEPSAAPPVTGPGTAGARVLVTGASSGIGRAAALHLAERGADLVLAARRTEALDDVASQITALGRRAWTLRCDLADPLDAATLGERAQEAAGGVSGLLYAAGHLGFSPPGGDPASAGRTFAVNLHSYIAVAEDLTSRWRQDGVPGSLVAVASVSSTLSPVAGLDYYGASKAAMVQYTRCLAVSVARHGIRANCVAPGIIETPMGDAAGPAHRRGWISRIPAGRVGLPQEVAAVCGHLLGPSAARVTGAVLRVDGGFGLGDIAPLRPGHTTKEPA
ncbi:SDR family NAD(P)-dependent oxidoreductase [Streptomyces sp. MI02-7b]|uniref:SDR family NAD(P)-dependent oxidoreductase n=1 Tax=Streptomyces sp. MI02-7b TaxID=462941 RepID=UPI0029ADB587|nr:SDR family NAD(P)-dependent oxidoreductase [Streptomyces sp. MI02-7b]MDX3072647.1 SDR family NAD(P)-dependent oxidoreductase [Streptomyces sp. MI02-7b]